MDAKVLTNAGTAKDAMLRHMAHLRPQNIQSEQRYSLLKQIDETNVGKLGHWLGFHAPRMPGARGGTEGTPLMWNDTIYQTMDNSIVYAPGTRAPGELKWMYDAKIDPVTQSHMRCGTHNRGLAISDGKIILAANDARLIGAPGRRQRQGVVAEQHRGHQSVLLVDHCAAHRGAMLSHGVGGGEYFIRGFLAAYNLKDGSLAWKFHTVPPAPGPGLLEDEAQQKAAKTSQGDWGQVRGGVSRVGRLGV